MKTRTLKIALVATGLAALPMLSSAANSPPSMDGCVKAFMSLLSSKDGSALKLREAHYLDDGSLVSATSELTLTARDAHDNHAVARAVCTADAQGQVVDVREEPLGLQLN